MSTATLTLDAPAGVSVPPLVLRTSNGEWAAALYASDMPTRRAQHAPEQLIAWIVQGVERLGGESEAWRLDHAAREARREADMRRLFPRPLRYDRAIGAAFGLSLDLADVGVRRGFRSVWVEVPSWDPEMCVPDVVFQQVPARDVEMHQRVYGGEAPKVVPAPVCTRGNPVVMLRSAA